MDSGKVNIYIGGESTNRDEIFLGNIVEGNNNKKTIIIAPENKLYYYENMILELKNGINTNIEVLSFSRMPYILFKKTKNRNNIYIDEIIKEMYISKIIEKERKNENLLIFNNDKIIKEISDIFSNIFENGIQRSQIGSYIEKEEKSILSLKMKDILTIYDKYIEKKIDKLDKEEIYTKILEDIESNNYFDNADIYIIGFTSFKEIQLQILEKIINKSYQNNNTIAINITIDNIISNNEIFKTTKKTLSSIINICNNMNVNIIKGNQSEESNNSKSNLNILKEKLDEESIYEFGNIVDDRVEKDDSILIAKFENKKEEIEFVVKNIYMLLNCRDNEYEANDIQIIMNDKEQYNYILKEIFNKYGLKIDIDNDRKNNIVIPYVLSILKIISGNIFEKISYIKKSEILKNDLFIEKNIRELDIYLLEKYLKRWNIYTITQDFKYGKNSEKYEAILNTKQVVLEYIRILEDKINGKSGYEISKNIFEYLEENEIISKLFNEKGNRDEIISEVIILNEILDRMSYLEESTLEEYIKYFEMMIKEQDSFRVKGKDELSIITTDNVVNSKITYILSADEMNFPKMLERKELLTNSEKEKLIENNIQILSLDEDIENKEEIEAYIAITSPKEKLIITYTDKDIKGQEILPSIYVKNIQKAFGYEIYKNNKIGKHADEKDEYNNSNIKKRIIENIEESYFTKEFLMYEIQKAINVIEDEKIKLSKEEYQNIIKIYNMYLNGIFNILEEDSLQYFKEDKNMPPKIEKELLDKIYLGGNIHTSISRLEKYAECPFSYHLRYGLNIKDRSNQSNNYFANIGTFLHEIIKETFDYIKENNINEKITNGGLPKKSVYTLKEELLLTQDKELEDNVQKYIYEIENIVNKSIEKVKQKEQFQEFKFKKNNEIILNKIENEVNKICLDINEGIRLSEFKILKNEATFGSGKRDYENIVYDIDSKSKVFLEGAIDRIDVSDINEFRIIDYKSSDKTIEIPKVINGLSLQLITYLSVIEEKLNLKPTAMLYKRLLYGIETKKEKMDNLQLIKKSKQDLKMTGKLIIDTTEEQEELYVHDVNLNVEGKVKSEIIDIEKTKDNIISKTKMKNILEREEYKDIKNKAFDKIKEISKNILRRKC